MDETLRSALLKVLKTYHEEHGIVNDLTEAECAAIVELMANLLTEGS